MCRSLQLEVNTERFLINTQLKYCSAKDGNRTLLNLKQTNEMMLSHCIPEILTQDCNQKNSPTKGIQAAD